jgi:hypothetical protein
MPMVFSMSAPRIWALGRNKTSIIHFSRGLSEFDIERMVKDAAEANAEADAKRRQFIEVQLSARDTSKQ